MHSEEMEILSASGQEDVATVFVGRSRRHPERMFEFVDGLDGRYPREEKWIINVSTQFGCPVGCLFCDAGGEFKGSISAELMLEQIRAVLDRHPPDLRLRCRKLKVHFSRMGEPALNPEVLDVLRVLPELIPNPDLWACLATVVPKGADGWFERLREIKGAHYRRRFQLQFSVNSTDEDCRRSLMPFSHHSLADLASLGRRFHRDGDRKIVLNAALAEGIPISPRVIGDLFDPGAFMVKLTPLNPTAAGRASGLRTALAPARPGRADELGAELNALGFDVVVSIGDPREDQIGSNCGQAVRRMAASLPV